MHAGEMTRKEMGIGLPTLLFAGMILVLPEIAGGIWLLTVVGVL